MVAVNMTVRTFMAMVRTRIPQATTAAAGLDTDSLKTCIAVCQVHGPSNT